MEITSYTELLGDMVKNSSTQHKLQYYTPQLDKCNLVQDVNPIKLLLQKNEIYISHHTKDKIN